jgi:hypothetical protein
MVVVPVVEYGAKSGHGKHWKDPGASLYVPGGHCWHPAPNLGSLNHPGLHKIWRVQGVGGEMGGGGGSTGEGACRWRWVMVVCVRGGGGSRRKCDVVYPTVYVCASV